MKGVNCIVAEFLGKSFRLEFDEGLLVNPRGKTDAEGRLQIQVAHKFWGDRREFILLCGTPMRPLRTSAGAVVSFSFSGDFPDVLDLDQLFDRIIMEQ